jgi:hypothetical protein
LAVQAARPATMVLVRDELLSILGDSSLFDLDTDGRKIIVHTDRLEGEQLAAVTDMLERFVPQFIEVVQYNHHIEISWRDINKYAHCETTEQMYKVDPTATTLLEPYGSPIYYTRDLTSDGDFVYPLPNLKTVTNAHHVNGGFFKNVTAQHFRISLPKITSLYALFGLIKAGTIDVDAPNAASGYDACLCMNAYNLRKFSTNATTKFLFMAFYGDTKLEEIEMDFSKANDLTNAFYGCKLNKKTVLKLSDELPTVSGDKPVTIGIHGDNKYDPEVNLALKKVDINYTPTVELPEEVTEGKGWTLTVQWNDTSTAQASTFNMGTLIYAKVGEHELPDGTTEQFLDWGHYVTNWEARGYEQFRSLESAYRYFGLPEPWEPLTNN